MPPSAPWYFPVIGSVFAIIVVKEFFGGIGFDFINPALGGRAFLVALFFTEMFKISWPDPPFNRITPDVVTSATPLEILNSGGSLSGQELFNTFVGNIGGRLGETSTLLILIGGAVFGAFFMATDYASTPSTRAGEYLFAFCCGVLVMVFRHYGVTEEGVSYSILIMNCLTPLIDYVLRNRIVGEAGNQLLNIKWNK